VTAAEPGAVVPPPKAPGDVMPPKGTVPGRAAFATVLAGTAAACQARSTPRRPP
jgi:hypothetical protein